MTVKSIVALGAMMALALPGVASAVSTDMNVIVDGRAGTETRSVTVSVADLNLASDKGLRQADSRVNRAAREVCGWMRGSALNTLPNYVNCHDEALQGARSDLNNLAQRLG